MVFLFDSRPRLHHLAAQFESLLVKRMAGQNLLLAEATIRKLDSMKTELAGPEASPLERMLAARVVYTSLELSYLDGVLA